MCYRTKTVTARKVEKCNKKFRSHLTGGDLTVGKMHVPPGGRFLCEPQSVFQLHGIQQLLLDWGHEAVPRLGVFLGPFRSQRGRWIGAGQAERDGCEGELVLVEAERTHRVVDVGVRHFSRQGFSAEEIQGAE